MSVTADVSQSESVNNCFKQILDKYKRAPDIIVNSAGITRDGFMLRMKEEDFDKVVDVNLKGTFLVSQVVNLLSTFNDNKMLMFVGGCKFDEGAAAAGIHREHRECGGEDWQHRADKLHRQ